MTNPLKRIPKIGDLVTLQGLSGTFEIIAVDSRRMTAHAKLVAPVGAYEERDVPWGVMFFAEEKVT